MELVRCTLASPSKPSPTLLELCSHDHHMTLHAHMTITWPYMMIARTFCVTSYDITKCCYGISWSKKIDSRIRKLHCRQKFGGENRPGIIVWYSNNMPKDMVSGKDGRMDGGWQTARGWKQDPQGMARRVGTIDRVQSRVAGAASLPPK